MAKSRKQMLNEQRRKQLAREKARLERAQNRPIGHEKSREQRKREALMRRILIGCVLIAVVLSVSLYMMLRTYHNYKIVRNSEQEDIISTKYVEMAGKILRYSPDGAALVNNKMQAVWGATYDMENPVADVRHNCAVIADIDGTDMVMFNKNGKTGSVTTSYSIVKASVSANGLVAAILDAGDDTWINFYAPDGSLIAENQTKIDDPGYPLDIAVSDNGVVMMVAYEFIEGGDITSYIAFYNFGSVGQNEDDKIVSGYTYKDVVIPQIEYLANNHSVGIRDDGFTIYAGKEIPKELMTEEVDGEIVSTFYDDDMIGLVFRSDDENTLYKMKVFTTSGKLKFTKGFNIPYTSIKVSDGNIIMYNSSQVNVLTSSGRDRFVGTIDGTIKDFFKIGLNRYLLVLDTGVSVIKFV